MPIVERRRNTTGDIDDVFALSQSYALRLDWDPFIRGQRPLGDATHAGKGVRTETISRHRLRMVTEYLTFRPPTLVGMKMVEGPRMFRTFSGSWHFAEQPGGQIEVVFRYNFVWRPAWLQRLMHPIGVWYLGRDIERRVAAFCTAVARPELIARARAERLVKVTG